MEQNGLATTDINALTTEILILKQQTAQNIIEIGKRLIAVKNNLPHGEWGRWLKEKVDFSHTSAKRFMQVAREFSNSPSLGDLPPTKVFALLDLPSEERENFVESNPVDDMTTRELQQAIKEKNEAIKQLENARRIAKEKSEEARKYADEKQKVESDARLTEKVLNDAKADIKKLQDTLQKEREKSKKEVENLQSTLAEARASGNNELVTQLQDQLQAADKKLTAAQVVEKVPDEVQKELDELRKNADHQKFKVYFDELVKNFQSLLGALSEIADPKEQERYKKAVSGLIGKMSEQL